MDIIYYLTTVLPTRTKSLRHVIIGVRLGGLLPKQDINDANEALIQGLYFFNANADNIPEKDSGLMKVHRHYSLYVIQVYFSLNMNNVWARTILLKSGIYRTWRKLST